MKSLIKEKEASLESRLSAKIKNMRGWSLKLLPTFVIGLPDRMCLLPGGRMFFAELKSTGEKPRRSQMSVHRRLEELGFKVYVIDSSKQMDQILADWRESTKDNSEKLKFALQRILNMNSKPYRLTRLEEIEINEIIREALHE